MSGESRGIVVTTILRLTTPWLWPSHENASSSFGVRTGRLIHWLFVGLALCALIAGAWSVYESSSAHQRSLEAAAAWDANHHLKPQTGGKFKVIAIRPKAEDIPPPPDDSGIAPDSDDSFADTSENARPDELEVNYLGLVVGFCCAFGLALAGRGFRYLVGNE